MYPFYVRIALNPTSIIQKTLAKNRDKSVISEGLSKTQICVATSKLQATPARYGPSCKSKINALNDR